MFIKYAGYPLEIIMSHTTPVAGPLSHLGVLQLSGEHTHSFLQGQIAGNMQLIKPEHGLFSCLCNHQGRVLASFILWQWQGAIYLGLPRSMVTVLQPHLQKYAAFSKVNVADISDAWTIWGEIHDPAVLDALHTQLRTPNQAPTPVSAGPWPCTPLSNGVHLAIPGPGKRRLTVQAIDRAAAPADSTLTNAWQTLDSAAGWVYITPELQGKYLPQMLNYDHLGAVAFDKGCFVGQEVIARLHHRGQAKQRLYAILSAPSHATKAPQPNDALLDSSGAPLGHWATVHTLPTPTAPDDAFAQATSRSAAPCYFGLAVLRLGSLTEQTITEGKLNIWALAQS